MRVFWLLGGPKVHWALGRGVHCALPPSPSVLGFGFVLGVLWFGLCPSLHTRKKRTKKFCVCVCGLKLKSKEKWARQEGSWL